MRCDVNLSLRPRRVGRARHPHRDQERQLAALGRAGGALRDRAAGRRARRGRHGGAGDPALPRGHRRSPRRAGARRRRGLPLLPGARPGAGGARPASGSSELRAALPELPAARRERLQAEWGSPTGAGAAAQRRRRSTWSWTTVAAGASAGEARKWWMGELARRANEPEHRAGRRCRSPRPRWPGWSALVAGGTLNDKLARQVLDGVLAGEGDAGRGRRRRAAWRWSSDDGALLAPRSTRRSRPTRTSPRRSATARSPRPARWSARS